MVTARGLLALVAIVLFLVCAFISPAPRDRLALLGAALLAWALVLPF